MAESTHNQFVGKFASIDRRHSATSLLVRLAPLLAIVLVALCMPVIARAEKITISAAVSLKEALTDAAAQYKQEAGEDVQFTFGSSGQLASQIESGAPVDVFISAANKQVDDLTKKGLVDESSRRVVAGNALVLIVPANATNAPKDFDDLGSAALKKLAVGEPRTVPAGQYAAQVLAATKQDKLLGNRLVWGANVRQVLDYVERGEVTAGIVYSTDAKQSGEKVKVIATADPSTHEPIVYPAVIVKASTKKSAATKFLDYLLGARGQAALAARGFTPPPAPLTTAPMSR